VGVDIGFYFGKDPKTGHWSYGVLASGKYGGGTIGLNGGVYCEWTDARKVADLKGIGDATGVSITPEIIGIGGGGDYVCGLNSRGGITYQGGALGLAAGAALLIEAHSLIAFTYGVDTDNGLGL
jgi:hypothetical protein